jgi:hypothetical protein
MDREYDTGASFELKKISIFPMAFFLSRTTPQTKTIA